MGYTIRLKDAAFERDPRRQQELAARPLIDAIYAEVFGGSIQIRRTELPQGAILDRHYAIDVQVSLPCGMQLTGQEKALSNKYARYNSLTVEYEQVAGTAQAGDWFRLACQFYFCGYLSEDSQSFVKWAVVNWPALVIATHVGQVPWKGNANQNGQARASFKYVELNRIPDNCVIAKGPQ